MLLVFMKMSINKKRWLLASKAVFMINFDNKMFLSYRILENFFPWIRDPGEAEGIVIKMS